ncbi:MAG: radical SAM protein [Deltaproteobacteria bacterium]|nr:radical SAM protein [Deltaproteobacteria bacterium]
MINGEDILIENRSPRVLLIRPPFFENKGSRGSSMDIPLGLLSIAAVLEQRGYMVGIYDARVEGRDVLAHRNFSNGYVFGSSWDEVEENVRKCSPDIVGISNQFTTQFFSALKTAEIVKTVDSRIVTVVGGPHASILPESFFENSPHIDIAVIGEGEYTLPEIAGWYQGKLSIDEIRGIVYKKAGHVIYNQPRSAIQNLDELPFPAYHLVDLERYFRLKKDPGSTGSARPRYNYPGSERSLSVITSRGCPFSCVFCSIHLHMGKKWRAHSPEYVLNHLEQLVTKYGIRHIHFEDDNISLHRSRFEEILDGVQKRGLNFTWDTPNGVRADTLDRGLLTKCKETGCVYLIIGIESGDQGVLDKVIRKKLSLEKVMKAIRLAHDIGLDMRAFYVIGFPGETKAQMKKTLELALALQRDWSVWPNVHVANPLIGTHLYEICRDGGFLVKGPGDNLFSLFSDEGRLKIQTEDFSPDDISELMKGFDQASRKIHHRAFLQGLLRAPKLALYIIVKSLKDVKRLKEFCADTVFFRHFLIKGLSPPVRSGGTAKEISPVIADA